MIIKKIFQVVLRHPWLFYLFNAITALLSAAAFNSISIYYRYISQFGSELPGFTNMVMENYKNILALGIVAVGISIFGFWKKKKEQNIDSIKKISFYLMVFTFVCFIVCLIAVYLPLPFNPTVIE